MYYQNSNGNILNSQFELVPQIEGNPLYEDYLIYLKGGGLVKTTDIFSTQELQDLEVEKEAQKKQMQFDQLSKTDWYVVRLMETGVAIPQEIIEQRNQIRNL